MTRVLHPLSLVRYFSLVPRKKIMVSVRFLLFLVALNFFGVTSMTRQQIKNSGKLLKRACMPKNNVTEDQVGEIEQGKFLQQRNVMCYIACIYSTSQAVKNNRIIHDAMIKQVEMMFPADLKEGMKAIIEQCKGVAQKYKDICEASFWTAKCMYEADPTNFLFP